MSQTAFLEEIVTWDEEKRAERVEEALPRLIVCLETYRSYDEAVGVLHMVCQSFVPVIPVDQLEDKLFSKLSQQVCQLLDAVLKDIQDSVSQHPTPDVPQLMALLQHGVSVVQSVEECVRHVTSATSATSATSQADDFHMGHVRSLLHCSFHVMKGAYSHCQESGGLYGDALPSLSDCLSMLFRTAHALQMVVVNVVDRLVTSQPSLQDIVTVIGELFTVLRVVSSLDIKLTISLWKVLTKLAGPQAEALQDEVDVTGMVVYLCDQLCAALPSLLLLPTSSPACPPHDQPSLCEGDDKVAQRTLRVAAFHSKVLGALVRDFKQHLSHSTSQLHRLLIMLNSKVPSRQPSKFEEDVRLSVLSASQPLLSHLIHDRAFCKAALLNKTASTDGEWNSSLGRLLLLVTVLDNVAQASRDVVSMWLQPSSSSSSENKDNSNLLTAVFSALDNCHTEVCLPVYLPASSHTGQHGSVSLYQNVVQHIAAFIASCPANLFHVVETGLLRAVLGSNPISCQAATDCWCFLARYGTADLCWQHTQHLVRLISHLCGDVGGGGGCGGGAVRNPHCIKPAPLPAPLRPLTFLLARLVKFLTPQHQSDLLSLLPPATHLHVWAEVGVRVFSETVTSDLCACLVPACLSGLSRFCQSSSSLSSSTSSSSSSPSLNKAYDVTVAMRCLHTVTDKLTAQQGALLLDAVNHMWESALPLPLPLFTSTPSPSSGPGHVLGLNPDTAVREVFLSALLLLTSDVVDQLPVALLLKILVSAHKVLKESSSRELTLAVLQLMQSLGRVRLPPSVEQGQILRTLSDAFATALAHSQAVVRFAALESFTRFAERTPHEDVVPECLQQHQQLQHTVTAFLQKTPLAEWSLSDTEQYLQRQRKQFETYWETETLNPETDCEENSSPSEPPSKRRKRDDDARQADSLQASCRSVLEELEKVTERLEKLGANNSLPDWALIRGRASVERLSACLLST